MILKKRNIHVKEIEDNRWWRS